MRWAHDPRDPRELPADERAILLVPKGIVVQDAWEATRRMLERQNEHAGPARLFFAPRARRYLVYRRGEERAGAGVWLELRRGRAYELVVVSQGEALQASVREVSRERYAALHRGDTLQPELARLVPFQPPALPPGAQPDGSVVVPEDDDAASRAVQFSGALFQCPGDAPLAQRTLATPHLVERCAGSHPDVLALRRPSSYVERERATLAIAECAEQRFAATRSFELEEPDLPALCGQVLGSGWALPTLEGLEVLSDRQREFLVAPRWALELGRDPAFLQPALFARVGDDVFYSKWVYPSAGTIHLGGVRLRCVRDAATLPPPLPPTAACPAVDAHSAGSAALPRSILR